MKPVTAAPDSVSAVVARILDQLSVSAWLPSAVLVASLVFVGHLAVEENGDLVGAARDLGRLGTVPLLLHFGAIIMLTTVTQAFEFSAIRLLEGYWGDRADWITRVTERRIRVRLGELDELQTERRRRHRRAVESCREDLWKEYDSTVGRTILDWFENELLGEEHTVDMSVVEDAAPDHWTEYAEPLALRRYYETVRRLEHYPERPHRVLPTRLGNLLRSCEERAFGADSSRMEQEVLLLFDEMPLALQAQHDEHRNQLNLYATLLFVVVLTGVIATVWLGLAHDGWYAAGAAGAAIVLGASTARAVRLAAQAYGSALVAIGVWRESRS